MRDVVLDQFHFVQTKMHKKLRLGQLDAQWNIDMDKNLG